MLGLEKKARGVVLLDLSEISPRPEVDHFVIMSSVSEPHQRALADHILEGLEERGVKRWHLEGYPSSTWILIDYHDVVVHIFRPESRAFYSLETLWGDARSEQLADEAEDGEARAHAPPPRGGRRERGA
jgi:ribosome-associated protein